MGNVLSVVVSNDNENVKPEETIKAIKDAGFKNVFVQWYDKEYETSQLQQVLLCKEYGLIIDFAHLGYQNLNKIWLDEGEYFVDRFKKNIFDCHNLGINMVVMHPCTKWDPPAPNKFGLKRFKQIVEYAESLGVKVAIENTKITDHIDYLIENIKSDNLGICFDAGHFHCNQKDNWNIEKYKNKVFCVHLHDNNGTADQHLLPFDGNIDWSKVIQILKDVNYDGPITLELCYSSKYLLNSINDFYRLGLERGEILKQMQNNEKIEIDDLNMSKISGGASRRDRTIIIELKLPESDQEKNISVYVDGELDSSKSKVIDPSIIYTQFRFTGSGVKSVKFKLNGQSYKEYTLDFESGTYY